MLSLLNQRCQKKKKKNSTFVVLKGTIDLAAIVCGARWQASNVRKGEDRQPAVMQCIHQNHSCQLCLLPPTT